MQQMRARMGAAQKHGRRAASLPEVQVTVLEQAASLQAQVAVRVWRRGRELNPRCVNTVGSFEGSSLPLAMPLR